MNWCSLHEGVKFRCVSVVAELVEEGEDGFAAVRVALWLFFACGDVSRELGDNEWLRTTSRWSKLACRRRPIHPPESLGAGP